MHFFHPHHPLFGLFIAGLGLILGIFLVLGVALGLPARGVWELSPIMFFMVFTWGNREKTQAWQMALLIGYACVWFTFAGGRIIFPAATLVSQTIIFVLGALLSHIRRGMGRE